MSRARGLEGRAPRFALLAGLLLAIAGGSASAELLKLPRGMGGVSDIGAIPCKVFSEMIVVAPQGTRLSLLTWAAGYYSATSGKALFDVVSAANTAGATWDFERLTGQLVDYCAANPEAVTSEAVKDLGRRLGLQETRPG